MKAIAVAAPETISEKLNLFFFFSHCSGIFYLVLPLNSVFWEQIHKVRVFDQIILDNTAQEFWIRRERVRIPAGRLFPSATV